jgi:hypothetical protein
MGVVHHLEESLHTVELDERQDSNECPHDILMSYFGDFRVLLQGNQDFVHEEEHDDEWGEEYHDEHSGLVESDPTKLVIFLAQSPRYERLRSAIQAIAEGKDAHVQQHISKTDSC